MSQNNVTAGFAAGAAARPIKIDADHFGIRVLVPTLTVALLLVVHLGGMVAVDRSVEGVNPACLVLPVDLVVLLGAGYVIERILKRLMPSRRRAELSDTALAITDRRRKPAQMTLIDWQQIVNVMAWRFEVRRRTRVPKGWFCLAVQLVQDEREVILYTFMSSAEAEKVSGYKNFARLRPRRETESNTDLRAAAEQRRLLRLEDARWRDGAEISKEDFLAMLAVLQRRVPDWD
ncbi:MAG: hypothetical protein HY866_09340 [Chloroflexi bacterium]|nr:hypothetical protein [Chloroflexota bacterium]